VKSFTNDPYDIVVELWFYGFLLAWVSLKEAEGIFRNFGGNNFVGNDIQHLKDKDCRSKREGFNIPFTGKFFNSLGFLKKKTIFPYNEFQNPPSKNFWQPL